MTKKKPGLTSIYITVPFHDNDPMGVVWHGNYYKYFEQARDALLQRAGFTIPMMGQSGFALPVVESSCKYRHALRYLQTVRVDAYLGEWENRVKFIFEIYDESVSDRPLARGYTLHAAIDCQTFEVMFEIPKALSEAFEKMFKEDEEKERG